MRRNFKKVAAVTCLAGALAGGTAVSASAIGSDLNGDKISWYSHIPCSDGARVVIDASWKYVGTTAGTYQTRLGLYTTGGARLALGPLQTWNAGNGQYLPAGYWGGTVSYSGEAEMTAFVWKLSGSTYVLVARETIGCY